MWKKLQRGLINRNNAILVIIPAIIYDENFIYTIKLIVWKKIYFIHIAEICTVYISRKCYLDRMAGQLFLIAELLEQLDGLLHILARASDSHLAK
jgi:hypothetical protein